MKYSHLYHIIVITILALAAPFAVPFSALGDQDLPPEQSDNQETETMDPRDSHRLHLSANATGSPPVFDMDDYKFGFGLKLNAQYAPVNRFLVGVEAGYTNLIMSSDSSRSVHLIDLRANMGYFVVAGLKPYLGVGLTLGGKEFYSESAFSPYFSLTIGVSYTMWFRKIKELGLELGVEIDMMFSDNFKEANNNGNVETNKIFAYPLATVGLRYSLGL